MINIAEKTKILIETISTKTRMNKKLLLVAGLLVAGIAALLLSEVVQPEQVVSAQTTAAPYADTVYEYEKKLEERLISMISSIEGAGSTKVMVTLESGSEDVYLHNYNYGENIEPSGENSMERKDEYVIVDGSAGEQGIVVRVAEPKVRGVAVVCEGGGSELVREQIVNTVTALLDISSARVSVAKMN
ncbi:MAG: hypothetical protein IJ264_02610 [Clostridia bacterium]|nr:hypothetical protein [Clostridia bacterium]